MAQHKNDASLGNITASATTAVRDADSGEDSVKIITVSEWFDAPETIHLLDLRDDDGITKIVHPLKVSLPKSDKKIVTIPLRDLRSRSFELPPRGKPFAILLSNPESLERLNDVLGPSEKSQKSRKRKRLVPWTINGMILDTVENLEQAQKRGLLAVNGPGKEDDAQNGQDFPLPRLWNPDNIVEETLLPILIQMDRTSTWDNEKILEIWDLGAGAGRDAAFLAESLKAQEASRSWKVVAMDQRYRNVETDPCAQFFERRGLRGSAQCKRVDLNNVASFAEIIKEKHSCKSAVLSCFVLVRYWNRELVEAIAASEFIHPGTIFAISHFGIPSKQGQWKFPYPKAINVLQFDELRHMFFEKDVNGGVKWELLHEKFVDDGDRGRPLLQFIVRHL